VYVCVCVCAHVHVHVHVCVCVCVRVRVCIGKGLWDSTQFGISHHFAVQCSLGVCAELEPIKLS